MLCILFGHRWELLAFTPDKICLRCHRVQPTARIETSLSDLHAHIERLKGLNERARHADHS